MTNSDNDMANQWPTMLGHWVICFLVMWTPAHRYSQPAKTSLGWVAQSSVRVVGHLQMTFTDHSY